MFFNKRVKVKSIFPVEAGLRKGIISWTNKSANPAAEETLIKSRLFIFSSSIYAFVVIKNNSLSVKNKHFSERFVFQKYNSGFFRNIFIPEITSFTKQLSLLGSQRLSLREPDWFMNRLLFMYSCSRKSGVDVFTHKYLSGHFITRYSTIEYKGDMICNMLV